MIFVVRVSAVNKSQTYWIKLLVKQNIIIKNVEAATPLVEPHNFLNRYNMLKNITRACAFFLFLTTLLSVNCTRKAEHYVTSKDGVRIEYSVKGKGAPAIVFIHGWLGDQSGWENQTEVFAKNNRVITIDLAGFGKSGFNRKTWTMAAFGEDIVSVMEHFNVEQAILVGHSMGSAAILEAAMQLPEKVIALVPVDVFQNVEQKFTSEQIEHEVNRRIFLIDDRLKLNPDDVVLKAGWLESLREYFRWRRDRLLKLLESIQIPITCINSDRQATDAEMAKKYAPSFTVEIVHGVGHAVMVEAPEEFNSLLKGIVQAINK